MYGGIAVAGNLLCVASSDARGRVFLIDVEDKRLASRWTYRGDSDPGGFSDAGGVAMDAGYSIWIADARNDVVRCFSPFGRAVGCLGAPHERAPGAARRDRVGVLDRPNAVALCGDIVLVACGDRRLVRGVQRFGRDGRALAPLRAFGEAEGRFGAPRGLHATGDDVFVADTLHGVVQRFRAHGPFVQQFATATRVGEASRPIALNTIEGGDLLVVEAGDRPGLRRFSPGGEQRELALDPRADLHEPLGVARDGQGRVYVLDRGGARVVRLWPDLSFDEPIVDLAEVAGDD